MYFASSVNYYIDVPRNPKGKSRVDDGMDFVLEKINDADFIKGFGHYIKFDDQFVVPKYQDVLYAKTKTIDIPGLIEQQRKYLSNNGFSVQCDGIYFLVPISAVIALPSGYQSNRIMLKDDVSVDKVMSVTLL